MNVNKVLGAIKLRLSFGMFRAADLLLDQLYEAWENNEVIMTTQQSQYMVYLITQRRKCNIK
jgi:hypothetical protein